MKKRRRDQKGYAILTVMIILLLLLGAGTWALRSASSEQRASGRFRKGELLFHAADAGAAHRLAEASLSRDPHAVFDNTLSPSYALWNDWPPPGTFASGGVDATGLQYRTGEVRMTWTGKTPPPGVPVGTNTYIFEFVSYATLNGTIGDPSQNGEAAVRVAFKTWDTLPGSYSP